MVASQAAAAAAAAGGWGALGHIGRGLRSAISPGAGTASSSDNGDGVDIAGDAGRAWGGWTRRGLRAPIRRIGAVSSGDTSASVGTASLDRLDALAGVRSGGDGRPMRTPISMMSVSRAHAPRRDAAGVASVGDVAAIAEKDAAKKTALRLTAGVMGTVVVRTVLAPFERMKLEYQLNRSVLPFAQAARKVLAAEGVRGFWRGNAINLLRVCPYKAINFAAFDAYRGLAVSLSPGGPHEVNEVLLAFAGAAAGITSVSSCFPMDVVRTRLLVTGGMDKYGGVRACISRLYKKEGMGAFYRGFLPAIIAMTPNGAVYYTVYDRLKMKRLKQLEAEEEAAREEKRGEARGRMSSTENDREPIRVEQGYMMLSGALAGASAEFSTYPLEVVRRRMQLQGGKGTMSQVMGRRALRRMTTTLSIIVRRHGLAGLYMGVVPSVAQVLPSAALGYYSYEMFKRFLNVGDE